MKIAIDFSDTTSLRKHKEELELLLEIVNKALGEIEQTVGLFPARRSDMSSVVDSLPVGFTMTEAISAGLASGIHDAKARRFIVRLVKEGKLRLEKQGRGRMPSFYRKIL